MLQNKQLRRFADGGLFRLAFDAMVVLRRHEAGDCLSEESDLNLV